MQKLEGLYLALQEEISKSEQGLSEKPIQQLITIRNELEQMKANKNYMPIFPMIIIDSWEHEDRLGQELMEIFTIYKRLNYKRKSP